MPTTGKQTSAQGGFWDRFWENARKTNMEGAAFRYERFKPYLAEAVLDFGCGEGSFLEYLRQNTGLKVLGVDVFKNSWYGFPLVIYGGDRLPFREKSVPCSTANFVLHHTPDPEAALGEMARVTRDRVILLEDMPRTAWQNFVLHFNHVMFDVFMIALSKFSSFEWSSDFQYRFRTDEQWKAIFQRVNLTLEEEVDVVTDYPVPFKIYVLRPEA